MTAMAISVIIPTLNEAKVLAQTIADLRRLGAREILVVDAGSTDATRAASSGADLFLEGPRGRSFQMNAGAARARGDVFLFLHADCRLESGALLVAERCLARPGVVAGCFRMRVQASGLLYRTIDFSASARTRFCGLIYGDQGMFVRRSMFEQVGGFPAVRFLEDVLISARLRERGRLIVAPAKIFVSPRRWQRKGIVRQTVRNWSLLGLAACGVHPDRLAKYYPMER